MSSRKEELNMFMAKIGYKFNNLDLLNTALTHSSYNNEKKSTHKHNNERLEFLGDAILDAVISQYLYARFENFEEGDLTRMRANIVCESSLADCGVKFQIGQYFLLGKGEENTGGRDRSSIIADTVEAVFGAVYLDGGWDHANRFILNCLQEIIEEVVQGKRYSDFKTKFQEIIQAKTDLDIQYETVKEEGPDHNKTFYVNVSVGREVKGNGSGRSKKEAEQNAAKDALSEMNIIEI
ncbi:MAG: ribonuclease III [Clostridia bacterium]|nr:ribonuclease III [Clostridia bacterium]